MNELEHMVFSMPDIKAIQLNDETYEECANLCKSNDFVLVKHDVGYVKLKMFHKFGSSWWLMTKEYAKHVQRINEGVLNG